MYSVLIMSCDKFEDTWEPFYKLYTKYFLNDCKTYICTETKDCPYFTTIKTEGMWTKRVREALEYIDTKYVFFMLDDFFIHEKVDVERINSVLTHFDDNTACFSFEQSCDYQDEVCSIGGFKIRSNKRPYLHSCQPTMWNRKVLIEYLNKDQTPWEWETELVDTKYKHYIVYKNKPINIGYDLTQQPWGIVQGKWARETKELFDREGIEVDYEKRGFIN